MICWDNQVMRKPFKRVLLSYLLENAGKIIVFMSDI